MKTNKYAIIGALKNNPNIEGIIKSSFTCKSDVKQALNDKNNRLIIVILVNLIANSSASLSNPFAIKDTISLVKINEKINIIIDTIESIVINLLA
ncbi:hypothetical protein D3C76_1075940 [compost metagenome]